MRNHKPTKLTATMNSRRELLRQMAAVALGLPLSTTTTLAVFGETAAQQQNDRQHTRAASAPIPTVLSPEDDQFLNDVEQRAFLFFWEQTNPRTGLTKDRCNVRKQDNSYVASIASTGFGLTALCIGQMRQFVSHSDARQRVVAALSFLRDKLPNASRLLLSLRQYRNRREDMGFGSLIRRYCDALVRHPHLPPTFSRSLHYGIGKLHFQSC